jgi:hypothetical protein
MQIYLLFWHLHSQKNAVGHFHPQPNFPSTIDRIEFSNFISRSQSYKNLISSFFRFLLLSLSVCSIRKYFLCNKMAKHQSKKQKKSLFYEEKSLVGLTPEA